MERLPLTGPMIWTVVAESLVLEKRAAIVLEDANSDGSETAYYRVEVLVD